MTNKEILELLQAAQKPGTEQYKRREIFNRLNKALHDKSLEPLKDDDPNKICIRCLQQSLSLLYWGYLDHCPELLLCLFPIFSLLCSERLSEDSRQILAPIDWQLFLSAISSQHFYVFGPCGHTGVVS